MVLSHAGVFYAECKMKKIIVNKEEKGRDVFFTLMFKDHRQLPDGSASSLLRENELTEEA